MKEPPQLSPHFVHTRYPVRSWWKLIVLDEQNTTVKTAYLSASSFQSYGPWKIYKIDVYSKISLIFSIFQGPYLWNGKADRCAVFTVVFYSSRTIIFHQERTGYPLTSKWGERLMLCCGGSFLNFLRCSKIFHWAYPMFVWGGGGFSNLFAIYK